MNPPRPRPSQGLPILTEVVLISDRDLMGSAASRPDMSESRLENFVREPILVSEPSNSSDALISVANQQELMIQRVLFNLEQQVDSMFENRMRHAIEPTLNRVVETLVLETRNKLAASLREIVAQAIALELARNHPHINVAQEPPT